MTENKRFILVEYVNKGLFIQDNGDDKTQYFQGSKASLEKVVSLLNQLNNENEQLKSTIAQLIEQNRKNNDLLLSDIRILEKALWCSGCENDYGRLKELRREFIR